MAMGLLHPPAFQAPAHHLPACPGCALSLRRMFPPCRITPAAWRIHNLHTDHSPPSFPPFHALKHPGNPCIQPTPLQPCPSTTTDHRNVDIVSPIRTLLIDNYDSYTYNLYQLLSIINGAAPVVIKNDELGWEDLRRMLYEGGGFDNIVISPGPGSPTCPKDIGLCMQVLQECVDIPLLGVCMGHQALGYANGARVVHAPEPVHGRLSEIEHMGCALFKDIPSGHNSGFQVVRYHSLMLEAETLPEVLIPTAWTVSFGGPSLGEPSQTNATDGSQTGVSDTLETERKEEPCVGQENNGRLVAEWRKNQSASGIDLNNRQPLNDKGARIIMAVSHRNRPHYGVQFHPESVATAFGKQVLENFRDLTIKFWQSSLPRKSYKDALLADASQSGRQASQIEPFVVSDSSFKAGSLRLHWEKLDGLAHEAGGSEGIFCGLYGDDAASDTFWLDSSSQHGGAHFSFLGGKGGRLWKRFTYRISESKSFPCQGLLTVEDNNGFTEAKHTEKGFLDFLSSALRSFSAPTSDMQGLPFDFCGGFVGYLGYELKVECGAHSNKHKSEVPDACYFFVDRFIAVDHSNDDIYVVALFEEGDDHKQYNDMHTETANGSVFTKRENFMKCNMNGIGTASVQTSAGASNNSVVPHEDAAAKAWVKETVRKIIDLAEGGVDMAVERRYSSWLASSSSLKSSKSGTDFSPLKSRKQYIQDVKDCLNYIKDGESYELCLTTQLQKRVESLDALGLYLTLRKMNPAPYAAWLHFGKEEVCICCSSPERFLRLDQDGNLEAKPIKGTIPRGRSLKEDEVLKSKLQNSEKDQAENLMIVDLLRNDLGRVCKPGSVHVPSLMAVESYATVHTMVSTVRGAKREDVTPVDCVRAAFPGGSMTGAPKLRSMELLDSLESSPRGVYSGTIGFFSLNSSFDLNIVIRTLVIHKGIASIGAGGAIVSLSDPEDEYQEMLLKAKAPIRAVTQLESYTNLSNKGTENGPLLPALERT